MHHCLNPTQQTVHPACFSTPQPQPALSSGYERPQHGDVTHLNVTQQAFHPVAALCCRDRLAAMKQEAERRATLERQGHGTYTEISEGEFLEAVTKTENVVCHFYHGEFERCKIVDKHMAMLAKRYLEARFMKISAPVS